MSEVPPVVTTFEVEGMDKVISALETIAAKSESTTNKIASNNAKAEISYLRMATSVAGLSTAGLMLEGTWQRVSEGQMSMAEGMLRSIPAMVSMAAAIWTLVGASKAHAVASSIAHSISSLGLAVPFIAAAAIAGSAIALAAIASVPSMKTGGIITSPTIALLGEAGPEAVVPLTQNWSTQSRTVHIGSIIIQAARDPEETGRAVMREIAASGG